MAPAQGDTNEKWPSGERNNNLARLAGAMRRLGASVSAIEAALLEQNRQWCAPPLSEKEVRQVAKSIGRYPPADVNSRPTTAPLNGAGMSTPAAGAPVGEQPACSTESGHEDAASGAQQDNDHAWDTVGLTKGKALLSLAGAGSYFHTEDGAAFAVVPVNGHQEVCRVRSKTFREWLVRQYYNSRHEPPGKEALECAVGVLEAKAKIEMSERPVHLRVAEHNGNIYLDLADKSWRAVEVTKSGWKVVANPPVLFCREKGMLPLPVPEYGGSVTDLRPFLNLPDDPQWVLFVAWIMAALLPHGPYPILVLQGEQGSCKSTAARTARALVDPSTVMLRSKPREDRELFIAANNSRVLAIDNMSGIEDWLSDGLCCIATGGGYAKRENYTDTDEVILNVERPLILNGIDDIAIRPDLADRSLILTLPRMGDAYRPESELNAELERAMPKIFGAFLDGVSAVLANVEKVSLPTYPRMADFAKRITAAEPALPWDPGMFMEVYTGNRKDAMSAALDADLVGTTCVTLIVGCKSWSGYAGDLLALLSKRAPEGAANSRSWHKKPEKSVVQAETYCSGTESAGGSRRVRLSG